MLFCVLFRSPNRMSPFSPLSFPQPPLRSPDLDHFSQQPISLLNAPKGPGTTPFPAVRGRLSTPSLRLFSQERLLNLPTPLILALRELSTFLGWRHSGAGPSVSRSPSFWFVFFRTGSGLLGVSQGPPTCASQAYLHPFLSGTYFPLARRFYGSLRMHGRQRSLFPNAGHLSPFSPWTIIRF